MVASRTDVDRCGAGYSDPPFALQGGHCERRSKEPEESHQHHYELSSDDGRPTGEERPEALSEPWPQGKLLRHAGVGYEMFLSLDVPVPQMGEQLPNVVQFFAAQLPVVAEPVIEVPKIFLDTTPQRLGDHLRQP